MEEEKHQGSPEIIKDRQGSNISQTTRILFIFVVLLILLAAILLLIQQVQKQQSVMSRADEDKKSEEVTIGNAVTEEVSEVIFITSPQDGDVLADPVRVEVQVTEAIAPQKVEFWMDNEKEPFYVAEEGPFSVVAGDLHPGNHTFYVKAFEQDGNSKISKEVQIRIVPATEAQLRGRGEKE